MDYKTHTDMFFKRIYWYLFCGFWFFGLLYNWITTGYILNIAEMGFSEFLVYGAIFLVSFVLVWVVFFIIKLIFSPYVSARFKEIVAEEEEETKRQQRERREQEKNDREFEEDRQYKRQLEKDRMKLEMEREVDLKFNLKERIENLKITEQNRVRVAQIERELMEAQGKQLDDLYSEIKEFERLQG